MLGVSGPPQPLLPFATRAPGGGGTGEHVELPVVEWVRFGCARKMREIGDKDGVSLPVGMSRLASLLAWCVDYSMAMIGVYGVDKHSHESHNLLLEIISIYNIYIYVFYNPKPH